jgi:hypothetical protein
MITYNLYKYLLYIFYVFFDVWKLFYKHNYIHIYNFTLVWYATSITTYKIINTRLWMILMWPYFVCWNLKTNQNGQYWISYLWKYSYHNLCKLVKIAWKNHPNWIKAMNKSFACNYEMKRRDFTSGVRHESPGS